MSVHLVVVSGGLGLPSATRNLADQITAATLRSCDERAASYAITVVELRDLAVPLGAFMATRVAEPRLQRALDSVAGADALIAVTPVFRASYSGLFKMFFDAVDEQALVNKPVIIAATGGSARHSLVLDYALRPLFAYLRAKVMPTGVYAATDDFSARGEDSLSSRVARAASELTTYLDLRAGTAVPAPTPQPGLLPSDTSGYDAASGGKDAEVIPFEQMLAQVRGEPDPA